MDIRTEVREIEKHTQAMTSDKAEQIAVMSKAQGLTKDEHSITVLAIAKMRVIHSM